MSWAEAADLARKADREGGPRIRVPRPRRDRDAAGDTVVEGDEQEGEA